MSGKSKQTRVERKKERENNRALSVIEAALASHPVC